MSEQWRDIPNHQGIYQVSDMGHVRSLPRVVTCRDGQARKFAGKTLRPALNEKGYAVVNLRRPGVSKTFLVNKLVIEAFRGPTPQGMETRHLNGIPDDNRLGNLAFGTPVDNAADKIRHGTYWRTHCIRGHEMSGSNLVAGPRQRKCRTCRDAYGHEYRRRLRDIAALNADTTTDPADDTAGLFGGDQ